MKNLYIDFDGVSFIGCVLENCDLSNKNIDESLIKNTTFKNCKLSGVSFIDSFLKNCFFEFVNGRYLNMSGANISSLKILKSDLSDSSFMDVKLKKLILEEVNFQGAEFLNTPLKEVDFSSSNITNAMFDLCSVKGMIINSFQSVSLVSLLGVCVKE